jgi:transposase
MYCENWVNLNITNSEPQKLTSQRISDLLSSISFSDRMEFYSKWGKMRQEIEYIANDITSISSYSNINEFVESGYNREGDKLKQINLCLLFGEKSGLPIFTVQYPGSLNDVSTLCTTIDQFSLLRDNEYKFVLDKGFYSVRNVNSMLNTEKLREFLLAVPFGKKFAKEALAKCSDILIDDNIVSAGADILYSKKSLIPWKNNNKVINLNLYTFFNQKLSVLAKDILYEKSFMLIDKIKKEEATQKDYKDIKKYLIVPEGDQKASLKTITINKDQINKEIKYTGWLMVLGNAYLPTNDVINIYRSKDVVEIGFEQL